MIYAISGLKRTGKDTASKFIQELTGAVPYALAHPIKKSIHNGLQRIQKTKDISFADVNGETEYDREQDLGLTTLELKSLLNNAIMFCHRHNNFTFGEMHKLFNSVSEFRSSDKMTIKDMLCIGFAEFFGNKKKAAEIENKYKWSIRRLMQVLGTDLVVNVRRDYWLECIPDDGKDIIITDVRQAHEMQFCRDNGAKVIFICKTGIVSTDSHITERGLEPSASDIIVFNDGTLEALKKNIKSIV
ncbi:dNMP kinase [Aeromonas phage AS-zj]|uniref:DNMP kinase n=3 Tax=Caudoviricetes TaxID=2731619 RepID=A0A291LDC6_9CAUD|nr:dNMP kinase [Aeromonas phage AS-zj]ASU00204.1 dNMP kinase [Aeromonas phage AS-zj]ATI17389.1 dNMP kinase [Aeromonas phage AS-szw]QAX99116.1 dNMP kinase [Aeromonas phage Assk]UKM62870.1 putative deoxynucleotide monophosphate kinase [Aeromonas phage P19]